MGDSRNKKLEKAGKIFLGVVESGIDCMESSARLYAGNRKTPNEYKRKYLDMAENLSGIKDVVHDYKNRLGNEAEVEEKFNDEYVEKTKTYSQEQLVSYIPKCYDNREKAKRQEETASETIPINNDEICEWEKEWKFLGKLKNVNCKNIELEKAGLIRLSLNDEIVYLVRAIEINNGGISKKISSFQVISDKKTGINAKISNNFNEIMVEVICIGNDNKAVDLCRHLEKILIKKYSPKWM